MPQDCVPVRHIPSWSVFKQHSAELKAKGGEPFAGITYEVENPDSKIVTENITDSERCCQLCADNHRCDDAFSLLSHRGL